MLHNKYVCWQYSPPYACPWMNVGRQIGENKDWPVEKETKVYQKSYYWNVQKIILFLFFTCILSDYVADEITKEFWKNSHFENMRADFPLKCQNSLRWNTPEIMHFQAWKKNVFTNIVPKWLFFTLNVVCNSSRWSFDQFLGQ